jgi:hypothetical protein
VDSTPFLDDRNPMKATKTKPAKPSKTKPSNLELWLASPAWKKYMGPHYAFRVAVAAEIMWGKGTLASVAKQFGKTRQAAGNHAREFRLAFGLR